MKQEKYLRGESSNLPVHLQKPVAKDSLVTRLIHQLPSKTDPMGMYTGHPVDEYEGPVQDADDL